MPNHQSFERVQEQKQDHVSSSCQKLEWFPMTALDMLNIKEAARQLGCPETWISSGSQNACLFRHRVSESHSGARTGFLLFRRFLVNNELALTYRSVEKG
jgi:hypothetical protein